MKLFNAVAAPQDGVVATIHVENGEDVMAGQPLFTLAPAPQLRAAE
jgi:biotin carboxyl carrier protein